MIGTVNYTNASRRFALLTPPGKSRAYDIFAADVWWYVAGLDPPVVGQISEFDVSANRDGHMEAVRVRNPAL